MRLRLLEESSERERMLPGCGRLQAIAASVVIVGMFYYFARPGLSYYFTDDDVMNLRFAWPIPVRELLRQVIMFSPEAYRPVHMLFYRVMYTLAGLNPAPFHWVTFGLLIFNVALLFLFARSLTKSTE